MQYRKDNISGNDLSALGLGCMRFPRDYKKTEELVVSAVRAGINYFDTAYMYAGSEETLGSILAGNGLRDKVYIATKLPLVFCKKPSDFDKFFNKQLERLKTDHIDYYLMHMLSDAKRWETLRSFGIEEWLKEKKEEGKIRRIGFSFHGSLPDFLELLDVYDWEFCLIQYNYSDENYQAGVKGLKKAFEKGIPVIVMEPLLGGKLANGLPGEAVKVFSDADPSISPAIWAFRWLLDQPEVTVVLSGMNSLAQLEENVKGVSESEESMLSEKEHEVFSKVKNIFNASFKIKCTGCNYCMPCPHGVNIPSCFAAYNTFHSMGRTAGMQQYFMSTGATSQKQQYASLCKRCGKCEQLCPQHIEIIKSLKAVKKDLEPFWLKPVLRIARAFLGIKGEQGL